MSVAASSTGVPPAMAGSLSAVLQRVRSSPQGLGAAEARARLAVAGPNEPAGHRRRAALRELVTLLANPLVIILLLASLASAALGEEINAAIIVVMVALSVVLNFVQSYRSQRAADPCARRSRPRPARSAMATGRTCRAASSSPET